MWWCRGGGRCFGIGNVTLGYSLCRCCFSHAFAQPFCTILFQLACLLDCCGTLCDDRTYGDHIVFSQDRSFKVPKWLEYFFAYCGVQALQGNPIDWVSTHRYHHQFCDSDRDPP